MSKQTTNLIFERYRGSKPFPPRWSVTHSTGKRWPLLSNVSDQARLSALRASARSDSDVAGAGLWRGVSK